MSLTSFTPQLTSEAWSPERRLMAAVLLQAIEDYRLLTSWKSARAHTERRVGHGFWLSHKRLRATEQYLFSNDAPEHPFSAANICEHLGLPIAKLRERLRAGDIPMQRRRGA